MTITSIQHKLQMYNFLCYNLEQTDPVIGNMVVKYIFCIRLKDACSESWKTSNKCQVVASK